MLFLHVIMAMVVNSSKHLCLCIHPPSGRKNSRIRRLAQSIGLLLSTIHNFPLSPLQTSLPLHPAFPHCLLFFFFFLSLKEKKRKKFNIVTHTLVMYSPLSTAYHGLFYSMGFQRMPPNYTHCWPETGFLINGFAGKDL